MIVFAAKRVALAMAGLAIIGAAMAQEKVVNVYSGRHYQTDEAQEGRDAYVQKRRPEFEKFPKRP